jgi:hypothetical protein
MPLGVFEIGIIHVSSLLHFRTWSRSLTWLPQEALHFETHTEEVALAGTRVRYTGGSQLVSRRQYLEFVSGTLQ